MRPLTFEEKQQRQQIVDDSANRILGKLWATMYHLQDLVGITRTQIADCSDYARGRIDHQPEKVFAMHLMDRLQVELSKYPEGWDDHAVDAVTPEGVSFDREQLNADVRAEVEAALATRWRIIELRKSVREAGECNG